MGLCGPALSMPQEAEGVQFGGGGEWAARVLRAPCCTVCGGLSSLPHTVHDQSHGGAWQGLRMICTVSGEAFTVPVFGLAAGSLSV